VSPVPSRPSLSQARGWSRALGWPCPGIGAGASCWSCVGDPTPDAHAAAPRSAPDPTPDAHAAAPRFAPRPPGPSDAGTTPAATTDPPAHPDRPHTHSDQASRALSAGPPHTGARPQRPGTLPGPPAQPDTAATPRPAPPASPAPSAVAKTTEQAAKGKVNATAGVTHLPDRMSHRNRNRVHNLSPRNRNQRVQHLPGSHKAAAHYVPIENTSLGTMSALPSGSQTA
jgi:hypothetical protein